MKKCAVDVKTDSSWRLRYNGCVGLSNFASIVHRASSHLIWHVKRVRTNWADAIKVVCNYYWVIILLSGERPATRMCTFQCKYTHRSRSALHVQWAEHSASWMRPVWIGVSTTHSCSIIPAATIFSTKNFGASWKSNKLQSFSPVFSPSHTCQVLRLQSSSLSYTHQFDANGKCFCFFSSGTESISDFVVGAAAHATNALNAAGDKAQERCTQLIESQSIWLHRVYVQRKRKASEREEEKLNLRLKKEDEEEDVNMWCEATEGENEKDRNAFQFKENRIYFCRSHSSSLNENGRTRIVGGPTATTTTIQSKYNDHTECGYYKWTADGCVNCHRDQFKQFK